MGNSVLVFVSHSSGDKESYIEPIVADLETCFLNVWIDKRRIVPGENLRKSILKEGLGKADVVLIFFTSQSLQSRWVDQEIKHVLREEFEKGNQFDLNKIISVFDSQSTYEEIAKRYPELTDDLLHLMPVKYDKHHLGQLISAIWSKYLSLQGGDVETQRQLLEKDREIFQKEKEKNELETAIKELKAHRAGDSVNEEFDRVLTSGRLESFVLNKQQLLTSDWVEHYGQFNAAEAIAFGYAETSGTRIKLTKDGRSFLKWYILEKENQK